MNKKIMKSFTDYLIYRIEELQKDVLREWKSVNEEDLQEIEEDTKYLIEKRDFYLYGISEPVITIQNQILKKENSNTTCRFSLEDMEDEEIYFLINWLKTQENLSFRTELPVLEITWK